MLRVALVQLGVGAKKTTNVAKAVSFIKQATDKAKVYKCSQKAKNALKLTDG